MQSPVRPRHVGVYMSGEGNQFDPNLFTKEITTENAVTRAEVLLTARAALEKQLSDIAESS